MVIFHRANGRLIPARAGNIANCAADLIKYAAHPRSRGEHWDVGTGIMREFGSSPLARGTSSTFLGLVMKRRLIPARAGNIAPARRCRSQSPAHPRSRGEHRRFLLIFGLSAGSSPLARGTFAAIRLNRQRLWLIPARAGNI